METVTSNAALRRAATLVAVALLTACASSKPAKFACPAEQTGYGCRSTLEIYEITSQPGVTDARQLTARERRAWSRSRQSPQSVPTNNHAMRVRGESLALAAPVQQDMGAFVAPAALSLAGASAAMGVAEGDAPVARMPAQVMRIWIAPWTDERGDLHRPSHIYTEIVARRWAVGGDVRAESGGQASFDPNGPMVPTTLLEGNQHAR